MKLIIIVKINASKKRITTSLVTIEIFQGKQKIAKENNILCVFNLKKANLEERD